jgi:hypothetical protein
MNRSSSSRSLLHLQMGQEVIYVLMALGLMAALALACIIFSENDCSVPSNLNKVACSPRAMQEKPPILNLTEKGGFYFESGSIAIRSDFKEKLITRVVPQIIDLGSLYHADVVEVIGHTDDVPVKGGKSSMDQRLMRFLNGASADDLAPAVADNVDLGMGRAAAVIRVLRDDPRLRSMTFLPLSAGQTTGPDDRLLEDDKIAATPDEQRRRIEVRLRRRFG